MVVLRRWSLIVAPKGASRAQARAEHLAPCFVFLAASLLFHLPAWARGLVPTEDDVEVFYFPLLVAASEALGEGRLALWTPRIFGGYPLFADGEAGLLYPIHVALLPWLAPETSLVVLPIVHSVLAGLFTYALLRALTVGATAGVIGGLVYAYSGFVAGQVVHPNVTAALVWLPLELAFIERSFAAPGWARIRWAVLAGAAFGIQGLAVHVHITLMSALVTTAFVGYRALAGAPRFGRRYPAPLHAARWVTSAGLTLGVVGLVGATLAAVQLIPLYELGQQTYRSRGLEPALADVNSLWAGDFLTLLLPRLFDTPSGDYWGRWVKWETSLYVGILPLLLAPLGLFAARPHRMFFGATALASVLLGLGPDAPLPLWARLHELPGFDVLRSPARFSLTFALAIAVLSAYGIEWLRLRPRPALPAAAAVAMAGACLAAGAGYALEHASSNLRPLDGAAADLLHRYLQLPGVPQMVGGTRLTAERLAQLASANVDPSSPAVAWQMALLIASAACLALWLLGRSVRPLAASVTTVLVFADLWLVGATFHPYERIDDLRPAVPPFLLGEHAAPVRVYTPPTVGDKVTAVEPNRLLGTGVEEANGYSSLQTDRHLTYVQAVEYADNDLLDLWNVRYVVRRRMPELLPSHGLTSFHPDRPLFSGRLGTPGAGGVLLPDDGDARADELRVVTSLWEATEVAQGTPVARITLEAPSGALRRVHLRAGEHVSDAQANVPGLSGSAKHRAVPAAFTFQRIDSDDFRYGEELSYGQLPIVPPLTVRRLTVENLLPTGGLEVYGVGLLNAATGEVTQVRHKGKYRMVYQDDDMSILENRDAMPRAFLVGQAIVVPPGADALTLMLEGPFDPRVSALIEGPVPPNVSLPSGSQGLRASGIATIASRRPREVVVHVATEQDALLVLSDSWFPGWVARVDGERTALLRANYLFRAVGVPRGNHTVTFSYEPLSVAVGAITTVGAALLVLAMPVFQVLAALLRRRLVHPRAERVHALRWMRRRSIGDLETGILRFIAPLQCLRKSLKVDLEGPPPRRMRGREFLRRPSN